MNVAGLVLAAGAGRRYGMPKALVAYQGRLLVQRAVDTLRAAGCARTLVVLGASAERVRSEALDLPEIVVNGDWASGMGSSLRAGLSELAGGLLSAGDGGSAGGAVSPGGAVSAGEAVSIGGAAEAAVVLLVDMPGVTAEAVRRVIAHASADALVMGGYDGRRGHPVLLGRNHWAGVAATATGDKGARDYLRAHAGDVLVVPVGDVADDKDIDVPADLK